MQNKTSMDNFNFFLTKKEKKFFQKNAGNCKKICNQTAAWLSTAKQHSKTGGV